MEKLQELTGSKTVSKVAVVYDFQNRWALENASGFQNANKSTSAPASINIKNFGNAVSMWM